MHHQGVFRVSGSQHEITDFKNQFESGLFTYLNDYFLFVVNVVLAKLTQFKTKSTTLIIH